MTDKPDPSTETKVLPNDDEPFGRQPEPVKVLFEGDSRDVAYYTQILMKAAGFKGDMVQKTEAGFTIYPRAVND